MQLRRSLILYKRLLKEADAFPSAKIGRKIKSNVRDAFQIARLNNNKDDAEKLLNQGEAVLRLLQQLRNLEQAHFQAIFGGF